MRELFRASMTNADLNQQCADEKDVTEHVTQWLNRNGVAVQPDAVRQLVDTVTGEVTRARLGLGLIAEARLEQKANEVLVIDTYKPGQSAVIRFNAEKLMTLEVGDKLFVSSRPTVPAAGNVAIAGLIEKAKSAESALSLASSYRDITQGRDGHRIEHALAGIRTALTDAGAWCLDQSKTEASPLVTVSVSNLLEKAKAAESFISGFEGDELQEGIDELLEGLRQAIDAFPAAP